MRSTTSPTRRSLSRRDGRLLQVYNTNVLFDFLQMINPTVFQMMSLIINKMIDEWATGRKGSIIVIDDHTHFEKVSHDIALT